MSTAVAKDPKPAAKPAPGAVPPEEQFWKRYSAHGEAPMSLAGSFAAHALGFGGLLLFSIYLASLLFNPARSLPVESVRFQPDAGGSPKGGKGPGTGAAKPVDDVGNEPDPMVEEERKRPALDPAELKKVEQDYDPNTARWITDRNTEPAKNFARLGKKLSKVLPLNDEPPGGRGGSGSGVKGTGTGPGEGAGAGEGVSRAKLSTRVKRMIRLRLDFRTRDDLDYLNQLRSLGAILAFQVGANPDPVLKVVRKLQPGGQLLDEDVARLDCIYWVDRDQPSVVGILNALRIRIDPPPDFFIAFMPRPLEERLFQEERRYVERVLGQKFDEDKIELTKFRVVSTGGGYKPELESVKMMPTR